jgi:hypothetical protein
MQVESVYDHYEQEKLLILQQHYPQVLLPLQ